MTLPGVSFLDHTADVGMDVEAASLEELLHRSALGMLALLRGEDDEDDGGDAAGDTAGDAGAAPTHAARHSASNGSEPADAPAESAPLDLEEASASALLASWLRELLFLHEVEHRDYVGFSPRALDERSLRAVVRTRRGGHAVREIKGVTYHALCVEEVGGRWRARVIFDV